MHILLFRVFRIKENKTTVQVNDHVILKILVIDLTSAFDKTDLYTTVLANNAWVMPIILATKKKSGNKNMKAFLEDYAKTVLYLENPQNTKKRDEYQLFAQKNL